MAKKYTADTFEGDVTGNVTGSASLNVLTAGDTMTGNLTIENTSAQPKLTIGDIDSVTNTQSGATLEIGNRATSGLLGSANIDLINGSYSGGGINFFNGDDATGGDIATPRAVIQSSYTGSATDYNFQLTHYNGSSVDNLMSMRTDHTYFSQPIRIGANASANELDDYEEGTFTPTLTTSGSQSSISFKEGKYTKIGDTVFVQIRTRDSVSEDESNAIVSCTNLPFTVADTSSFTYAIGTAHGSAYASSTTYAGRQYCRAADNTTTLYFRNGQLTNIGFESDGQSEISAFIWYKTS